MDERYTGYTKELHESDLTQELGAQGPGAGGGAAAFGGHG